MLRFKDLPNDVLRHILASLPYDDISKSRMVCRRFNLIAKSLLNAGFLQAQRYHKSVQKKIKSLLPRRESERRSHHLVRSCDVLNSIETRISLLAMTYQKYIEMRYCCFIPGKVLDELFKVIRIIESDAKSIPARGRVGFLTEFRDLSYMSIEHFDEVIAPVYSKMQTEKIITIAIRQLLSICGGSDSRAEFVKICEAALNLYENYVQELRTLVDMQKRGYVMKQNIGRIQKEISLLKDLNTEQAKKLQEHESKLSLVLSLSSNVNQNANQASANNVLDAVNIPGSSRADLNLIEFPSKRVRRCSFVNARIRLAQLKKRFDCRNNSPDTTKTELPASTSQKSVVKPKKRTCSAVGLKCDGKNPKRSVLVNDFPASLVIKQESDDDYNLWPSETFKIKEEIKEEPVETLSDLDDEYMEQEASMIKAISKKRQSANNLECRRPITRSLASKSFKKNKFTLSQK